MQSKNKASIIIKERTNICQLHISIFTQAISLTSFFVYLYTLYPNIIKQQETQIEINVVILQAILKIN